MWKVQWFNFWSLNIFFSYNWTILYSTTMGVDSNKGSACNIYDHLLWSSGSCELVIIFSDIFRNQSKVHQVAVACMSVIVEEMLGEETKPIIILIKKCIKSID